MKTILALILTVLFSSANAFAITMDVSLLPHVEETTLDYRVLVIDGSGSMRDFLVQSDPTSGVKMEIAKTALKRVIDQIPMSTHVGILKFDDPLGGNTAQIAWIAPIGPMNKDFLKHEIDKINPDGGTPLGETIRQAGDALLAARKAHGNLGTYQLLVVTDGEADDSVKMDFFAPEAKRRRLQLDVIGVGMHGDHQLATMAHHYWRANDEISLNKALQTAVQVENTDAATAQADYDLLSGLSDDVAKAWLAEVTNMDLENQPLGEPKEVSEAPGNVGNADPNVATNNPTEEPQPSGVPAQYQKKRGCSARATGDNPVAASVMTLCLIGLLVARRRMKTVRVRLQTPP